MKFEMYVQLGKGGHLQGFVAVQWLSSSHGEPLKGCQEQARCARASVVQSEDAVLMILQEMRELYDMRWQLSLGDGVVVLLTASSAGCPQNDFIDR